MKDAPFTANRLLALYDQVAEAEDAIPRLRRFVLDLAVRGKLGEQDPSDEPAAELLKRIAKEKARRRVTGEKRKEAELKRYDGRDVPFAPPPGWLWVPMGELGETNVGLTYSPNDVSKTGTPVLRSSNIQNGKLDFEDLVRVKSTPKEGTMVEDGDLLICARNGSRALVGKVAIIENLREPFAFGAFMAIFRSEVNRYLYTFISSPLFRSVIDEVNTTTINQITQNNLRSTLAPLPPLAEQQRIVAKVDDLMALCDQLEQARAGREAVRDRLTAATWARLTAPETDAETFPTHARFALQTLPTLTTRPDQIKTLRQTILNLAVRGKLVAQDAADEPAAELLKRIGKERAIVRKRSAPFPSVGNEEESFGTPEGWQWQRFGEVFSIKTGFAFQSPTYSDKGVLVLRVVNFDRSGAFDFSDVKFFPSEKVDQKISQFLLRDGEILMVMVGGTIGKTTMVSKDILPALLNQNMWRIRSYGELMNGRFEHMLIRYLNQTIENLTHSTHGHFAMSDFEQRVVCVPPIAEQRRIVARVDALMALCDQLEASLATTATTRRTLLDALLHEALEPISDAFEAVE